MLGNVHLCRLEIVNVEDTAQKYIPQHVFLGLSLTGSLGALAVLSQIPQ